MDKFHYCGNAECGWTRQAPPLLLPNTRFTLVSATLGDITFLQSDLQRRTGREVAALDSAKRSMPLEMGYRVGLIEKLSVELAHHNQLPAYLVYPSQRVAVEEVSRLTALDLDLGLDATQIQYSKIEAETVGPNSAFGKTLCLPLLKSIGVHHAGVLLRYHRLVERLAGLGSLKLISDTDTLGVGINVPIRTVVMTSLMKFDDAKERHLNTREFHQVVGCAGRAGSDTAGYVSVPAPEREVGGAVALARAGDGLRRQTWVEKKQVPEGCATWSEGTFRRLVDSELGTPPPR